MKNKTTPELVARRAELASQLASVTGERAQNVTTSIAAIDTEIASRDAQLARIRQLAHDPKGTLPGSGGHGYETAERGPVLAGRESREDMRGNALRCVDDQSHLLDAKAGDRLVELIEHDEAGTEGVYLRAVANPAYGTAFAKLVTNPTLAAAQMSDAERHAVETVSSAVRFRGMAGGFSASLGVGSGDLPLPLTVDPTILPTSAGVESPIRTLADVRTISTTEYKAAVSAGVSAHFVAEGTEVSDDTPTVDPITIVPQRAQVFATFSMEAAMDYAQLQGELYKMFSDSKAILEGTKFVSGAGEGSNEPEGIVTGGTVVVTTAGTATLAVADLEATQEAVSPRWQANAVWLGNLTTRNTIDQLVAQADASHAKITDEQGNVLRRPYHETSDLASPPTSTHKVLVYGDIGAAYRIVDRIGMAVEIVPQIFGSSQRPQGIRGFYAIWRTSAQVVNPAAIRVLVMR